MEEVQLEDYTRQIETFTNFFGWIDDNQGENEDICLLFRKQLEGKADQLIEEEEKINLNIWKNIKSQF